MIKKEIMLTGKEVKEFAQTGHTEHTYGGITYVVTSNEKGLPVVTGAKVLSQDLPAVNFAGYINYVVNDMPLYKGN